MRKLISPDDLARDDRFDRSNMMDRIADPRNAEPEDPKAQRRNGRLTPDRADSADAARALMHGIFVGEIQALEGAGRTCYDFEVGAGRGRRARSSSSSTWPASAGTRPATARSA